MASFVQAGKSRFIATETIQHRLNMWVAVFALQTISITSQRVLSQEICATGYSRESAAAFILPVVNSPGITNVVLLDPQIPKTELWTNNSSRFLQGFSRGDIASGELICDINRRLVMQPPVDMSSSLGVPIAGYIGREEFKDRLFEFDRSSSAFTISTQKGSTTKLSTEFSEEPDMSLGFIIPINGHPIKFQISFSLDAELLLSADVLRKLGIDNAQLQPCSIIDYNKGKSEGFFGYVKSLDFAGCTVNDTEITTSEADECAIGIRFLKRMHFTLNNMDNRFVLSFDGNIDNNMSLYRRDFECVMNTFGMKILNKHPGGLSLSQIEAETTVLSIDGIPTAGNFVSTNCERLCQAIVFGGEIVVTDSKVSVKLHPSKNVDLLDERNRKLPKILMNDEVTPSPE